MTENSKPRNGSVGMPEWLYLHEFGSIIVSVFGHMPYQVGSSLYEKTWRDIDVRLMLGDDEYDEMFPLQKKYPNTLTDGKWCGLCMVFSELGRKMTGLPIDFQIQKQSEANKKYPGGRQALGFVETRTKK